MAVELKNHGVNVLNLALEEAAPLPEFDFGLDGNPDAGKWILKTLNKNIDKGESFRNSQILRDAKIIDERLFALFGAYLSAYAQEEWQKDASQATVTDWTFKMTVSGLEFFSPGYNAAAQKEKWESYRDAIDLYANGYLSLGILGIATLFPKEVSNLGKEHLPLILKSLARSLEEGRVDKYASIAAGATIIYPELSLEELMFTEDVLNKIKKVTKTKTNSELAVPPQLILARNICLILNKRVELGRGKFEVFDGKRQWKGQRTTWEMPTERSF